MLSMVFNVYNIEEVQMRREFKTISNHKETHPSYGVHQLNNKAGLRLEIVGNDFVTQHLNRGSP